MGVEMLILCQIGMNKRPPNMPYNIIDAFNKMHTCYMVQAEWDIGGSKRNLQGWWNDLMLQNLIT